MKSDEQREANIFEVLMDVHRRG